MVTSAIKRGDILLAVLVLCVAGLWLLARLFFAADGGAPVAVVIQSHNGQEDGQSYTLPLSQDTRLSLTGNGIPVVIEVKDGAISFVQSDCPDKICVQSGALSKPGQTAACVPAGILIKIESSKENEVDAVAK